MLFLQTNHYFLWKVPLLGAPQAVHTPVAPYIISYLQMPTLGRGRRNEHVPDEGRGETESSTREILNEKNCSSPINANQFLKLVPGAEACHGSVAGKEATAILAEPAFVLDTAMDVKPTGKNALHPDSDAFVSCTRCVILGKSLCYSGSQYHPYLQNEGSDHHF